MITYQYAQRLATNFNQSTISRLPAKRWPSQLATHTRTSNNCLKQWGILIMLTLLFALFSTNTPAQALSKQLILQGSVTDGNARGIQGVKVSTVPNAHTTYTDAKGQFNLTITSRTKMIVCTKQGYQIKRIKIKAAGTVLHIQLKPKRRDSTRQPLSADSHLVKAIGGSPKPGVLYVRGRNTALAGVATGVHFNRGYYGYRTSESYAHVKENGFKATISAPFSTFSVDVDKASYSNVRRFIQNGNRPPVDAVRIEELINYFDYHYDDPKGQAPIHIQPELSYAPWNPAHYLLRIGLKTKQVPTTELPASNLVFLIDVSGSMAFNNKLPLLVSAFKMLTSQLRAKDYVSIVTYAGTAKTVLTPTSGSQKAVIKAALDQLSAAGSTNGAGGLKTAYSLAEQHFRKNGNNRIILASDGDFNVGVSSLHDLESLITQKRKSGIYLSVLGFGMGNYKDDKMELLADKGNGNYAYIDNSSEARRTLLKEFGGTLFTVAKDVKVQVQFNPAIVKAYRLVGYENRALADQDFNRDTVDAAEMGSGSTVTALYEIIAQGTKDPFTPRLDTLRYFFNQLTKTGTGLHKELALISVRYKAPNSTKSRLLSKVVGNHPTALKNTSADYQLAAAAASWGMLLTNSAYRQKASYDQVVKLLSTPLAEDKTGQVGELLELVKTSQALEGNEANKGSDSADLPILRPRPRPIPYPRPLKRKKPMVMQVLPITGAASGKISQKGHSHDKGKANGESSLIHQPVCRLFGSANKVWMRVVVVG